MAAALLLAIATVGTAIGAWAHLTDDSNRPVRYRPQHVRSTK